MCRRPLLIAACGLFLAALASVPHCSGQTLKGKAIVISVTPKNRKKPDKDILALHTPKGQVKIDYDKPKDIDGIQSGMNLEVVVEVKQPAGGGVQAAGAKGKRPTFKAKKIKASGKPKGKTAVTAAVVPNSDDDGVVGAASGTPNKITMSRNQVYTSQLPVLFVPIAAKDGCAGAQKPKLSVDELRKTIFGEKYKDGYTVSHTFNQCSMGNTQLTNQNSMVTDLVELPCSGVANDVPWTFAKCDFDDFNGYSSAANEVLKSRGINLDKYKYRVYYIPPGACGFVGLGYVGCDGSYECRVWIGGDHWGEPQAVVHEIGHNIFFNHAGATNGGEFDEYADDSCAMGYCCGDRCWNTPHIWQAGWVAAQQLDDTNLKPGQTVRVNLASQSDKAEELKNPRYALRISPTWAAGQDAIFVGYRTRAPNSPDSKLDDFWAGKVTVYTAPISNNLDASFSTWRGNMAAGETWESPKTGLVLRFRRVTPKKTAVVTVCRKAGPETATSCALKVDNDCNGLVGDKDPACQKIAKQDGDKTELR